jgi:hypothetical protein
MAPAQPDPHLGDAVINVMDSITLRTRSPEWRLFVWSAFRWSIMSLHNSMKLPSRFNPPPYSSCAGLRPSLVNRKVVLLLIDHATRVIEEERPQSAPISLSEPQAIRLRIISQISNDADKITALAEVRVSTIQPVGLSCRLLSRNDVYRLPFRYRYRQ